jgi:hypothetical protein
MKEKQNEPLIAKINDLARIIKLRDIELKKAFDRISELQNLLNEYKDSEHAAIKAEGEALRKVAELEACKPYLKDGETPAECIQRNRDDAGRALKLLAAEKNKIGRVREKIISLRRRTWHVGPYSAVEQATGELQSALEDEDE